MTASEIDKLWYELEDVPFDPETEQIDVDWFIFRKGTDRETIWHWFDEQYPEGLGKRFF